ncbi:nicotinate-nucleotide adenylyltransferase [Halomonas sp. GXIMD04776]|uniref:nicotinate-nucleotide adenylyltransferase n=1 Tax=Halomonas sp. GXIMD04776 TaxID=3415605 RepID=UPI003CAEAFFB
MYAVEADPACPIRIAMLGGTFDPVHHGHLRSAVELREMLALDRVHMIPAQVPPHRAAPGVTGMARLEMLKAGIGETPGLVADDREQRRPGASYSVDTLASLRDEFGEQARLVMALGVDAFLKLAEWHEPERLFELAHVVVIARPGHSTSPDRALQALTQGREAADIASLFATSAGRLLHLRLPSRMDISATDLRRRLQTGLSVRYLLPSAVETYIQSHSLYR